MAFSTPIPFPHLDALRLSTPAGGIDLTKSPAELTQLFNELETAGLVLSTTSDGGFGAAITAAGLAALAALDGNASTGGGINPGLLGS
jgi:hypothetical protein